MCGAGSLRSRRRVLRKGDAMLLAANDSSKWAPRAKDDLSAPASILHSLVRRSPRSWTELARAGFGPHELASAAAELVLCRGETLIVPPSGLRLAWPKR
jgi:hypothetical protein